MGSNASAHIFYGFPLPNLIVSYHDLNEAWEKEHGPTRPEDRDYRSQAWEEWRTKKRAWESTLENVEISWGGAEDCEAYFVHCAGLELSVEWGELLAIDQASLAAVDSGAAREVLHKFCDQFNLPKAEPRWHLSARYF